MTGQLSRITIDVDVTHDRGDAVAHELAAIALSRVERALRDEGANPFGAGTGIGAIGPDAQDRVPGAP